MEIKKLRLDRGLTQREVAQRTGMTTHAVLRYEQGLYEHLSPNLTAYYATLIVGATPEMIQRTYTQDRILKQQYANEHFNSLPPLSIRAGEHPFLTFRKYITQRAVGKDSRMAFCILLALNPAVVYTYDMGKQPTMPSLIREGLLNAGVGEAYLQGLMQLGEIWYERNG